MKAFQVNCSELIANFNISNVDEMKAILKDLINEFEIDIFFELNNFNKERIFSKDTNIKIEHEGVMFNIQTKISEYSEKWEISCDDKDSLIEMISVKEVSKYEELTIIEYCEQVINLIEIILKDNEIEIKNNFYDLYDLQLIISCGKFNTTLRYGNNGYEDLGWYFQAEHFEEEAFPFFQWAEKNCRADIIPYDGGTDECYIEFKKNIEKIGLLKKNE